MDDKKILECIVPNFLNLKNFIHESVNAATIAIIEKDTTLSRVIHYESTNRKWHSFYTNASEAKVCHIMRAGAAMSELHKSFTLVWNLQTPDNEESIFLNEKRIELNHCNGISLCKNISDKLLFCALFSGAENDVGFVQNLLSCKHEFFNNIFHKVSK